MKPTTNAKKPSWLVYIIECDDKSLYTGITTHLASRFSKHCSAQGAKYFRAKRPLCVVYAEETLDRSSASKRESAIKGLSRREKLLLIQSEANNIAKFFPNRLGNEP